MKQGKILAIGASIAIMLFAISVNAETQNPKIIASKYSIDEIELCTDFAFYFETFGKLNSSPTIEAMGKELFKEYIKIGGAKLGSVNKYLDYIESRMSVSLSLKDRLDKQPREKLNNFYVNCYTMTQK